MIARTPREVATSFVLDRIERDLGISLATDLRRTLFDEVERLVADARAESRADLVEEALDVLDIDGEHEAGVEDQIVTILRRMSDEVCHLGKPDDETLDGYAQELCLVATASEQRRIGLLEDILDDDERARVAEKAVADTIANERRRKLP